MFYFTSALFWPIFPRLSFFFPPPPTKKKTILKKEKRKNTHVIISCIFVCQSCWNTHNNKRYPTEKVSLFLSVGCEVLCRHLSRLIMRLPVPTSKAHYLKMWNTNCHEQTKHTDVVLRSVSICFGKRQKRWAMF